MYGYIIETTAGRQGYYHNGEYLYRNPPIWARYIKVFRLNFAHKKEDLNLGYGHEDNKGKAELVFSFGKQPGMRPKYPTVYQRFYESKSTIGLIKFCIRLFLSNKLI